MPDRGRLLGPSSPALERLLLMPLRNIASRPVTNIDCFCALQFAGRQAAAWDSEYAIMQRVGRAAERDSERRR